MRNRARKNLPIFIAAAATCGIGIRDTLVSATTGADVQITDATSREISVFRPWPPSTTTDSISREVSVYREISCEPPECYVNASSREVSVFREFPALNSTDAVSREASALSVIPLTLETPYEGTLPMNSLLYFRVTAPPDATIRVTLHHGSSTAFTELLASFAVPPDSLTAQFSSESIGTGTRELVIPTTQNGTYFILVGSISDSNPNAPMTFNIVASTAVFGIDRVTPSTVGAGVATITIKGASFDESTTFTVRDPQTSFLLPSTAVTLLDAATALVTFDFSTLSFRSYDVLAEKSGSIVAYASAFEVEAPSAQHDVRLSHNFPSALRGGRPFHGLVQVANLGNLDIDAVIVEALVPNDPNIRLWPTSLSEGDTTPQEFGANKGFILATLVLAPGEQRTIPVSVLADTEVPAHTLLPIEFIARGLSKVAYRDGPLYRDSERVRLALLEDETLPGELRAFAQQPDEWWTIIRSHFDTYGFPQTTTTSSSSKVAAVSGLTVLLCGLNCLLVSVPLAAVPVVGPALGPAASLVCGYKCLRYCEDNEQQCNRRLGCVPSAVACGAASPMTGIVLPLVCAKICDDIVQSGDPNEKTGPAGFAGSPFVRGTDETNYRISFENVSAATAPAAEIRIFDDLDPWLDLSTVRFARIKFADTTIDVPPDRNTIHIVVDIRNAERDESLQVLVELKAGIDISNRRIWWNLTALDPATRQLPTDPSIGFLPPNVTPPEGEGYVEFTVKPLAVTPTGTVIRNKASIIFDYNDPIETNEVFNSIDSGAPLTNVQALPEQSMTPFVLRWVGADDDGGSGLSQYQIYVRTNGGPAELSYSGTDTWAHFDGEVGSTYAFYSIGVDNVGNTEALPAVLDAMTTVTAPRQLGDIDLDGDTDLDDFRAFVTCLAALGPGVEAPATCAEADLNGDRSIDLLDFGVLQTDFFGK